MSSPAVPEPDVATRVHRRARVVRAVRSFFVRRRFVEVDTAVAVAAPAPERYIDAPPVRLGVGTGALPRFLQTSPELPMKRLLAAGLPRIYQIAAVFRDGDFGPLHRPEFRLLEWYRAEAPWTALMDDCEQLLRACAAATGAPVRVGGRRIDLAAPFARLSVEAAFRRHVGISVLDHLTVPALSGALTGAGVAVSADDSWDDLFHRAYLARIEPALQAAGQPVFLTHFPLPLAALARPCADEPRAAERFELLVGGIELANAFGELTDPAAQRARFVAERARRQAAGCVDYPLDEAFLAALAHMPPAAGIALGLDRLLMVLYGAADIDQVAALPWQQT